MARIGSFKSTRTGFVGSVTTLKLQLRNVEFRAAEGNSASDQPAYRIFADGAEIGAAWKHTSERSGADFLSVSLDDPSFEAPISARLFASDTGFDLVWNRPSKKSEADPRPEPAAEA